MYSVYTSRDGALSFFFLLQLFLVLTLCSAFSPSLAKTGSLNRLRTPALQRGVCLSPLDELTVGIYDAQLFMSNAVETQLQTASWTSCGLLYVAGLLTSFSPCAISLLPLTLAYLGAADDSAKTDSRRVLAKSISYAAGLATTFAAFGLASAFLGQLFGSFATNTLGNFPAFIMATVSLVMGLNLLDIIEFSFPSVAEDGSMQSFANKLPETAQAFVLGSTSTLIASPCSSPILTSLLAFVASSGRPSLGALFLFVFSLGYATPVVAAAGASGFANSLDSSKGVAWVNIILGSVLVSLGTYSLLDSLATV